MRTEGLVDNLVILLALAEVILICSFGGKKIKELKVPSAVVFFFSFPIGT